MKASIIQGIFGALTLMATAFFANAATISNSFEVGDGFAVGNSGATYGQWVLPATATVVDTTAYDGTQSLKITGNGIVQWNPTPQQLGNNFNLFTFYVKADSFAADAQIGFWQVLYGGSKSESRIELQLYYGATSDSPLRAVFRSTYTGDGAPTDFTTVYLSNINIQDWTKISFGFNFEEEKYQIKVGEQIVAVYEPLAASVNLPRIARVFLRGNTTTHSYADLAVLENATVIPEPKLSMVLLLGAATLGAAVRRRRL